MFYQSNSNWTEWSIIQGVIARVISKSDEREARGRFENTSAITLCTTRSHGTKLYLLVSKLRSGTSKTKPGALFWKSHCAICSPVYIILYHVTGSCKGPIVRHEVKLLINRIYNKFRNKTFFWEVLLSENVCSAFHKF